MHAIKFDALMQLYGQWNKYFFKYALKKREIISD